MSDGTEELKALLEQFKEKLATFLKETKELKESLLTENVSKLAQRYYDSFGVVSIYFECFSKIKESQLLSIDNLKVKLEELMKNLERAKVDGNTTDAEWGLKILHLNALHNKLLKLPYPEHHASRGKFICKRE